MGEGTSSVAALVDAQFSNVRILLPYDDFEDDYQGLDGANPVAFPGGLDDRAAAGTAGFDPRLAKGHPVPRGSRISIGIPTFPAGNEIGQYRYAFIWRDRNLRDFRTTGAAGIRQPYHYPKQGFGATDNSGAVPVQYYPIDARVHCVGYEQAEPSTAGVLGSVTNLWIEWIVPMIWLVNMPLIPGGGGTSVVLQQGIYDPTKVSQAITAMRLELQLDCDGDDLIILCQKVPDEEGDFGTWDFNGDDREFSDVYGKGGTGVGDHPIFVDGGIRVNTGSNP